MSNPRDRYNYGPKTDRAIDTMSSEDSYADFAAVGMAFLDQGGISKETFDKIAALVADDVLAHTRKMGESARRDRVVRKVSLAGMV
jgi:hypothetical protein